MATLLRQSAQAGSRGSGLGSKLRLAGGPTAERALRRLPMEVRPRPLRARIGSLDVSYRLNAGDIQGIREVLVDEAYRVPFDARPHSIVDLGANIGLTSLFYADRYGPVSIVAVEPDPENAELARRNLAGTGAQVLEAAIAPRRGRAAFKVSVESNLGCLAPDGVLDVEAITMEDVLDLLPEGRADLLKIDIEGGEGALFSGTCSWLDRVGSIIIELHPLAVDVDSIISMIESAGFMYIPAGSVWPGSMDAFSRPVHP